MIKFRAEKRGGKFLVRDGTRAYTLTPPDIVRMSLPPYVKNLGDILSEISEKKKLEGDFFVEFFEGWAPDTDLRVRFERSEQGGRIYELNPGSLDISATVWVCDDSFLSFDGSMNARIV